MSEEVTTINTSVSDEPVENSLYFYCLDNWDDVKNAIDLLIENEDKLLESGDKVVEKIFDYASPLFLNGSSYEKENIFDAVDIASTSFISPLLIKEFIKNPSNQILRDRLAVQMSLVGAATQNMLKPNFQPYNMDEMLQIMIEGNDKIYNNITFLYTLRDVFDSEAIDERAAVIFSSLQPLDINNVEPAFYFWEEALEFNLILHIIWKNFVLFGSQQQEFILKNYLFSAIVAGVPVEYWLKSILSAEVDGFDNNKINTFFLKTIENSNERLPINTVTGESRKIIEILPDYVGKIYSGEIKTLTQEKFIESFYKGQLAEKKYSGWFRSLLQLYYNLRSGAYLPR